MQPREVGYNYIDVVDEVDIITRVYDEWGHISSENTQSGVSARVEDKNQIIKDRNGQEVTSNTFIILDPEIDISYDSKIKIKKKGGETFNYDLEMAILKIGKQEGFTLSHWEVWL